MKMKTDLPAQTSSPKELYHLYKAKREDLMLEKFALSQCLAQSFKKEKYSCESIYLAEKQAVVEETLEVITLLISCFVDCDFYNLPDKESLLKKSRYVKRFKNTLLTSEDYIKGLEEYYRTVEQTRIRAEIKRWKHGMTPWDTTPWDTKLSHGAKLSHGGKLSHGDSQSRITENMIQQAKAYPIDHLLEFNRSKKAFCLWHDERHPSLHYFEKDNHVYCFGCGESADVIKVAQKLWNITFIEAVRKLRRR